ncbi:hypothetical protein Trydic_g6857 [Trypoxylus dichotomus]
MLASASRAKQISADTASIKDIFTKLPVDASNPIHLGKYDSMNITRRRLVKITWPSTTCVNKVLRNSRKLKVYRDIAPLPSAGNRTVPIDELILYICTIKTCVVYVLRLLAFILSRR